jgi:NAD(P)-dependent dehydrogenase (short-subunit alcohol dehydrogenase family)
MAIKSLLNKKCFITGAASGIGKATAIAAAHEGAELFLTDINAQALEAVASLIRNEGGKVSLSKAMDVSDFEAIKNLAQEIHQAHGSMDVVMNIAGIAIWGDIRQLEHRDWRRAIEINLMGPVHVMECFIPEMIKAGRGGHLVNVSSAAGLFGLPFHAAYSASKFGLRGISEVLRFDLRRHGIGVSLVCPGGVDTGLVRTIEIRGVDTNDPVMTKLKQRFQKHAITPEKAASTILKGIKTGRYLVLTSPDVWLGYWSQRLFAPPYEFVMRLMNNHLYAVINRQTPQK